jgi:RNA polymerase sigma-70 factor (ECF subfamily)
VVSLGHSTRVLDGTLEPLSERSELLDEAVARGHVSARGFRVLDEVFRAYLASRLEGADDPAITALHVEDLYLACACVNGDRAAVNELDRQYASQFPLYLATLRQDDDFVAEVAQRVREKLLVGRPGKLAEYRGTGPLGGWLRVVVVRTAKDLLRASKAPAPEPPERASDDPDPEIGYLKRRCAAQLAQAFRETLSTLDADERAMLSLTFLDGLSSGAIGKMYGVDGSTVRRRLQTLRESILARTRELLAQTLGADTREVESLIDFARSRIDVDLTAVLRATS